MFNSYIPKSTYLCSYVAGCNNDYTSFNQLTIVVPVLLIVHTIEGGGEPSDVQLNVTFSPTKTLPRPTGGRLIVGLPTNA